MASDQEQILLGAVNSNLPPLGNTAAIFVISFRPLTGPIGPHRNSQRKRVKSGRIGRLNGRLTGQLLGRALNLMIGFDMVNSAA